MIGTSIAHYKVTAKLGAGGMGEVYRATDTKLSRDVALDLPPKVVPRFMSVPGPLIGPAFLYQL